jgi:hypothetical protein
LPSRWSRCSRPQEATANPSLSSTLKDKFGGLKKFLEKWSDDFFISNNHPFNPHVYLKATLTSEDVAFITSGGGVRPTCMTRRGGAPIVGAGDDYCGPMPQGD